MIDEKDYVEQKSYKDRVKRKLKEAEKFKAAKLEATKQHIKKQTLLAKLGKIGRSELFKFLMAMRAGTEKLDFQKMGEEIMESEHENIIASLDNSCSLIPDTSTELLSCKSRAMKKVWEMDNVHV